MTQSAHAAAPADRDAARIKVTEGRQHYNLGEFGPALEAYKEAYRLLDDPLLLFNIGQCQWKLHDDAGALHSYRSYLRNLPDAPNRAQVEARISEIERRTPADGAPETARRPTDGTPSPGSLQLLAPEPAPPAAPAATLVGTVPGSTPAAVAGGRPVYGRWWFWTAVGVLVIGATAGILLLRSGAPADPTCPRGASCGG